MISLLRKFYLWILWILHGIEISSNTTTSYKALDGDKMDILLLILLLLPQLLHLWSASLPFLGRAGQPVLACVALLLLPGDVRCSNSTLGFFPFVGVQGHLFASSNGVEVKRQTNDRMLCHVQSLPFRCFCWVQIKKKYMLLPPPIARGAGGWIRRSHAIAARHAGRCCNTGRIGRLPTTPCRADDGGARGGRN